MFIAPMLGSDRPVDRNRYRLTLASILAVVGLAWHARDQVCQAAFPDFVKVGIEEAEEAFFDGDYTEAVRRLEELDDWFDEPKNQRAVFMLGEDHSLCLSQIRGLKAEVLCELGEEAKSRVALDRARKLLIGRRTFYARSGVVLPDLWKYEAFLYFVEGDLTRATPDFGLTDFSDIPKELRQALSAASNVNKSVAAYREAEKILMRPPATLSNDTTLRRLRGRLLIALAHRSIYKEGLPKKADVEDALAYLDRAEEIFSQNPLWKQFVSPDAEAPISYKDIDQKIQGDAQTKTDAKRYFGQAVRDWLSLKSSRAELGACVEMKGENPLEVAKFISAERSYSRLLGYCRAQFHHEHPSISEIMLSKARWLMYLSNSMADTKEPQPKRAAATLLQDCIFDVDKLRACRNLSRRDSLECDILEFRAHRDLLRCDADLSLLEDVERARCEQRIGSLQARIEKFATVGGGGSGPAVVKGDKPRDTQGPYSCDEVESWSKPMQARQPAVFWADKKVFPKRGIVIEDQDYIVRTRYWVLDEAAVGRVTDVVLLSDGSRVRVEFIDRNGWQEKGINIRDRRVQTTKSTMTIRESQSGDGADVQKDEVTYSYRIEGMQMEPAGCGLIVESTDDKTVVEFPSNLLSLIRPYEGDTVVRGPDWSDGFADGGPVPVGQFSGDPDEFSGVIERRRDRDGFVEVKWKVTGRTTAHRFDSSGFYDLQTIEPKVSEAESP